MGRLDLGDRRADTCLACPVGGEGILRFADTLTG